MLPIPVYSINDYITFPVQAHNASGSAANLDTGSFNINFFQSTINTSAAPTAMSTPDTTFNTVLGNYSGLYYAKIQMTTANGFSANNMYFCRITGTVNSQTPALLYSWMIAADGSSELDAINTIAINSGNITTISGIINNISGIISLNSGIISTNNSTLNTISGNILTNYNNINNISGIINLNSGNITTLKNNVITISGNINTISNTLDTTSGNVTSNLTAIINTSGVIDLDTNNIISYLTTISGIININSGNITTIDNIIDINSGNITTLINNLFTTSGIINTVSGNINTSNNTINNISGLITTIKSYTDLLPNSTIDGKTHEEVMEILLAYSQGKIERADGVCVYKKQDNNTTLFTLTSAETTRTRS